MMDSLPDHEPSNATPIDQTIGSAARSEKMVDALTALRGVSFAYTQALADVWNDPPFHIADLNGGIVENVIDHFKTTTSPESRTPEGLVIQGAGGAGKTHMIGTLRRRVWELGGSFVLVDIVNVTNFWETTALSFLDSLYQTMPNGKLQYQNIVKAVRTRLFKDPTMKPIIDGYKGKPLTIAFLTQIYLEMLRKTDPKNTMKHQDVVRALILIGSNFGEDSNFGYTWLQGQNLDDKLRKQFNFQTSTPKTHEIVRGLLWFFSLAGPTMVAIDQIDSIVSASNQAALAAEDDKAEARKAGALIHILADGLMQLYDIEAGNRAMTVISCLEVTWPILHKKAIGTLSPRFPNMQRLAPVQKLTDVAELVGARLSRAYASAPFIPPYPTFPFEKTAIESALFLLPREILIRCNEHRMTCLAQGTVTECASLDKSNPAPPLNPDAAARIDALYAQEMRAADPGAFGANEADDAKTFIRLCNLYIEHLTLPNVIDGEVKPDANRKRASLHATIAFIFRALDDRQKRWCFRFLAQENPLAFQARLKSAITASGIDTVLKSRQLLILRDTPPPTGEKTRELVEKFTEAGGKFVKLTDADRRAFLGLISLADKNHPQFEPWLRLRRPLFATTLLQIAGLAPPAFLEAPASSETPTAPDTAKDTPDVETPTVAPATPPEMPATATGVESKTPEPAAKERLQEQPGPRAIKVGRKWDRANAGAPVMLEASLLPRHMTILGGPGSGKTVVLRRIIEEAALIGIPAIVLDVNNDLSRLGQPWPTRPDSFDDEDFAKAKAYQQKVEVVIWTPGVNAGNPLSLKLLPDFSAVSQGDDHESMDQRAQVVEMALATLEPYIGGTGEQNRLRRGVLANALESFARSGGGSLEDLIGLLADLPEDVSQISNASKRAREIADQLNAAKATNPLLKGRGANLDPATLFEGANGKTRISVINLGGLASDEAKQAFVNQMNAALFTWIKANPSPTGRLYAFDEAQNFAPSQTRTACKQSTVSLAAQARKYGLGMIFATQHPKGIENAIVSNSTTHLYGRLASPAAINAAQEIAAAKGGSVDDIARLSRGEFYFSTEGLSRPTKIQTPLCLTWHPANPPNAEEVTALARQQRQGDN